MTQPQQTLSPYGEKFQKFLMLIDQLHPNYRGQAWGFAHKDGLEDAIAFCESKI